jgi:hypothetical protein
MTRFQGTVIERRALSELIGGRSKYGQSKDTKLLKGSSKGEVMALNEPMADTPE